MDNVNLKNIMLILLAVVSSFIAGRKSSPLKIKTVVVTEYVIVEPELKRIESEIKQLRNKGKEILKTQ